MQTELDIVKEELKKLKSSKPDTSLKIKEDNKKEDNTNNIEKDNMNKL